VVSAPVVRRAVPADVPAIGRLVEEAYAKYVPRIGRKPAPMTVDYAAELAAARVWVVELDGHAVGTLVTKDVGDHLLLETVAVSPAAQGGGLGALLLRRAELDAAELGFDEVRLYTNEAMTENLTFYPRHGYVETERGLQDGFRRVFFVKKIGGADPRASR
jgi:N-acetylglutamate synthase-like GNAT family acetyltransferase